MNIHAGLLKELRCPWVLFLLKHINYSFSLCSLISLHVLSWHNFGDYHQSFPPWPIPPDGWVIRFLLSTWHKWIKHLFKRSLSPGVLFCLVVYDRHWHGKHRFTPSCHENRGGSLEDQFTCPQTIKFCCLEMIWAIGNSPEGLICHKSCELPVPFHKDSWEPAGLCLKNSNGQRQIHKTTESSHWSLLFAQFSICTVL